VRYFTKTEFEDYRTNTNAETGEYFLIVPLGRDYKFKITKQGFQPVEKDIYLKKFNSLQNIKIDFTLSPEK